MNIDNKISAFDRAARYLSVQARCEAEVRKYLRGKDYIEEEIEEAVLKLREYGYLNDFEYCQAYYRQAAARSKGRRRIESELLNKGVSKGVMTEAIDGLLEEAAACEKTAGSAGSGDPGAFRNGGLGAFEEPALGDERGRALAVGRKMARQQALDGKPLDERFQARVGRRLAGLGYSADTVYYVLGKLRQKGADWLDE